MFRFLSAQQSTNETTKRWEIHFFAILVLFLTGVILYANTLQSPFEFDDIPNITENPYIRISDFSIKTLLDAGWKSPSSRRPVANISFALNYYFGKYDTTGFHIVNILIHIINGILVYFLCLRICQHTVNSLSGNTPRSFFGGMSDIRVFLSFFSALMFIAHPIQTQSVTYIVQRMNTLAVMFYLFTLLLYIGARLTRSLWKRWIMIAAGLISWILALGSKEIAITLPIAVFLYEWFFFQNLDSAWLKKQIKYILVLIVFMAVISIVYTGGWPFDAIAKTFAKRSFTMEQRVLTQFRVIIFYFTLILFPLPSRLNLLHSFSISQSLIHPLSTLGSFGLILFLIGLAVALAKKHRLISFCIIWCFLHLALESSIIGLKIIFEHRLYLPMVGVSILFAYLLFISLRKKIFILQTVSILIVIALGTGTFLRNTTWQSDIGFNQDLLSKNPQSYLAHNYLGVALAAIGNTNEAIEHFKKALEINPDDAEIHNNLGVAFEKQGQEATAMEHYLKAVQINPDYAEAHNNIALRLAKNGKVQKAMEHYQTAIKAKPSLAGAHNNLAILFEAGGAFQSAQYHYLKAIQFKPDFAEAYNNLGIVLAKQGKIPESIQWFLKGLQIHPNDAKAYNNLGVVFSQQGNYPSAIGYFKNAIDRYPDFAEAHRNLGIALVHQDLYSEAIDHFTEALRINPDDVIAKNHREQLMEKINPLQGDADLKEHP